MSKRKQNTKSRVGYVGFLDYRPHIQLDNGARVMAVYVSKSAAQRAYSDVRKVRLVFDADWRME